MGNIVIPVDDRMYSTLEIGSHSFPIELFHDDLNNFQKGFVNWHKQIHIEISYVLEGSLKVCLLNEEYVISSGNAFIILPERLHSIQPVDDKPGKYFTIIFDPCLLTGYSNSYFEQTFYTPVINSSRSYYPILNDGRLSDVFSNLLWLYHNFSSETAIVEMEIQRRLQDIWVSLCYAVFETGPQRNAYIQDTKILQMITYLRQNYADKFSLTDMADNLHISRGECCRFFKKMMGMTISDYLLEYRLGKATELLNNTNTNITEIAHTVGFNSVSNFSAVFKEKIGCTPRCFRESARKTLALENNIT